MPILPLTALLLSLAAIDPPAAAQDVTLGEPAAVTVELISGAAAHAYEGALAILDPIQGLPSKFHAAAHEGVQIERLPKDGVIVFQGIPAGLYQLHLVDALGMPFLKEPGPVYVSAVAGASPVYRVETERLYLVEGSVVESSVGEPLSGATLRIDPRAAVGAAPLQQVLTDDEGLYRVYTARTEIVSIDSEYYRSINARFGDLPVAGTIRMRPMQKLRLLLVERAQDSNHPAAANVVLTSLPLPVDDSALHADGAGASHLTLAGEEGADGGVLFSELPCRRWLLEWPLELRGGENHGVHWLHELDTRRGGGPQTTALPKVELRRDALRATETFMTRWHIDCAMLVNRRTLLMAETRLDPPHRGMTLRLPSLPAGAPSPEWTLHCESLDAGQLGSSYQLRWRGEGDDPAAAGSTGLLREVRAGDVEGSLSIVFDGQWLTHGSVTAESPGTALVPAIGAGDLYGSSYAVRGDVVRQEVSVGQGAEEAAGVDASLRFPEVGELAALDLQFVQGDAPLRGLALRAVQKDAVIKDEILDLLGETPFVSDASGTVYLRDFVPGEYELRIDASKSMTQPDLTPLMIQLRPGSNEPRVIAIP